MRKIDLTDYQVGETTFQVRASIAAILFNEDGLDPREVIRRDELARTIENHPDSTILLEESDFFKIQRGLQATDLKPHGRSVVELARRIMDAPVVNVKEDDQ